MVLEKKTKMSKSESFPLIVWNTVFFGGCISASPTCSTVYKPSLGLFYWLYLCFPHLLYNIQAISRPIQAISRPIQAISRPILYLCFPYLLYNIQAISRPILWCKTTTLMQSVACKAVVLAQAMCTACQREAVVDYSVSE